MARYELRKINSPTSPYFCNENDSIQRKKLKIELKSNDVQETNGEEDTSLTSQKAAANLLSDICNKLSDDFYDAPCEELAVRLLGQRLVRILDDGTRLSGEIVETECYPGGDDAASHSFNGKRTDRNKAMFMNPGTAYVYYIYGMYNCFNISSRGDGAAVLIRALNPLEGLEIMQEHRLANKKTQDSKLKPFKNEHLCNGPSKLCQALKIEKTTANTENLANSQFLWLEKSKMVNSSDVVITQRIGINSTGEESVKKLLRFYILDHPCVSVRDKNADASKRLLKQTPLS